MSGRRDEEHIDPLFGRFGRSSYPSGVVGAYPSPPATEPFVNPYQTEGPLRSGAPLGTGVLMPHAHPGSIAPYEETWTIENTLIDDAARQARRVSKRVRADTFSMPHYHRLHDRLRTTEAWRYLNDVTFEGALNFPAAASTFALTNVPRTEITLPGSPGDKMLYLFFNLFSLALTATTLTGLWYVDLLFQGKIIPVGAFAGTGVPTGPMNVGLLTPVPLQGGIDDTTPLFTVRITANAGATISAVSAFGLISASYVYRHVSRPERVREANEDD